jgi:hypothetical protein
MEKIIYILFFLYLNLYRFFQLRKAIKIKQMVIWEIVHLILTLIFSVLLYLYIVRRD